MAEKNLVRLSLFLVLISFVFIYLIFADKNPELWNKQQQILVSDKNGEEIITVNPDETITNIDNPNYTEQDLLAKLNGATAQSKSLLILSGTNLVYNELESLTKLWLKPKYILQGKEWIYFVNLGKGEIELNFRASKFGGSVKTVTDITEIKKNWFILAIMNYINLPIWKDKYVVFTTKLNTDNRLVESSQKAYYDNKGYISQTLNSAY